MTTKQRSSPNSNPLWATDSIREPDIEPMSSGVPIQCQYCVGQTFRRSHLRGGDIPGLLLMRYPVRCARCSQRQTVSFTVAAVSIPSHIKHRQRSGSSSRASAPASPAPSPDSTSPGSVGAPRP